MNFTKELPEATCLRNSGLPEKLIRRTSIETFWWSTRTNFSDKHLEVKAISIEIQKKVPKEILTTKNPKKISKVTLEKNPKEIPMKVPNF